MQPPQPRKGEAQQGRPAGQKFLAGAGEEEIAQPPGQALFQARPLPDGKAGKGRRSRQSGEPSFFWQGSSPVYALVSGFYCITGKNRTQVLF
jgi:hypothetical protein